MVPPVDRSIHRPLSVRVKPTTDRIRYPTSGRCSDAGENLSSNDLQQATPAVTAGAASRPFPEAEFRIQQEPVPEDEFRGGCNLLVDHPPGRDLLSEEQRLTKQPDSC